MKAKNSGNSIIKGTFFTVSIRWVDRFVGLVSTFILARVLTPEDFGIVAIATLSVGLTNVFLNFGVQVPLIKIQDATKAHYDTAWTIKVLQGLLVTLILLVASPFVAEYFHAERSLKPLYFLAFMPFLTGLQNIGLVDFHKSMRFDAEFRYLVTRRVLGFFVTVVLAWTLRSYWALVFGSLATALIGTVLSYVIHPMRPSFSLKEWRPIFSISQWMLLKNIGEYLQGNLQNFFVGRWFSSSVLGSYTLAANISVMPSSELLAPFNRVLFPAFSRHQNNWPELKRLFLLAQGLQTLIAIPASAGLALVAQEAVPVLLGNKWLAAIPFVQILSWIGFFEAITTSSGYVMLVLGYVRLNVMVSFIQVGVFASLALLMSSGSDAIEIAWLRLVVAVVGALATFVLVRVVFPVVSVGDFVRNAIRPILGVIAMAASMYYLNPYMVYTLPIVLISKVVCGVVAYVLTIIFLWFLCKKPDGAESYLITKFVSMVRR
jgi:O-antigen/teichoic acid export membrane protein